MADNDIFNNNTPANPLETLVGDGKKFKSVEDLAAGKLEADEYIEQLKREQAEMREELNRRLAVEDQLRVLEEQRRQSANNQEVKTPPASEPALSKDDLVALVRQVNQEDQSTAQNSRNLQSVLDKLIDTYGDADKAKAAVAAKAEELGVSPQFLQEVAMKSPKAFLKQLDLDEQPRSTPAGTQSTVTPATLDRTVGAPKPGTYKYYENIRKTDPATYFKPEVQTQLHKDAQAARDRGEDFFN
jgi:hypothetical protein